MDDNSTWMVLLLFAQDFCVCMALVPQMHDNGDDNTTVGVFIAPNILFLTHIHNDEDEDDNTMVVVFIVPNFFFVKHKYIMTLVRMIILRSLCLRLPNSFW